MFFFVSEQMSSISSSTSSSDSSVGDTIPPADTTTNPKSISDGLTCKWTDDLEDVKSCQQNGKVIKWEQVCTCPGDVFGSMIGFGLLSAVLGVLMVVLFVKLVFVIKNKK
jgi:hypothetical protein